MRKKGEKGGHCAHPATAPHRGMASRIVANSQPAKSEKDHVSFSELKNSDEVVSRAMRATRENCSMMCNDIEVMLRW